MLLGELDDEARAKFNTHYRDGVIVRSVDAASRAHVAGVRTGDVIVELNNVEIKRLEDFKHAARLMRDDATARVRTTSGIGHIQGENKSQ
jgi:S1-C subfamily serine protease